MAKLVRVHHGGSILRTENDSVEFVGMKEEVLLFGETPSLASLTIRVRDRLGWTDGGEVSFEGRIDVGSSNGPRMKIMAPVGSEEEWQALVEIVMRSEVRVIDLVARKAGAVVLCQDGSQGIRASNEVPNPVQQTQPSQASVHEGVVHDPPPSVVNTQSVGDGDEVPHVVPVVEAVAEEIHGSPVHFEVAHDLVPDDTGYGVATDRVDVEVFGDDTNYDDERAVESDDDRPVGELNAWEREMLSKVVMDRDPLVPDCRDISQGHRAVADGDYEDNSVPRVELVDVIHTGLMFENMEALKMWLAEYSVLHCRPHQVKNSHEQRRYIVKCKRRGCPWTVRSRKTSGGKWKITSVVQPHTCGSDTPEDRHQQLTSKFIAKRLVNIIKHAPTLPVASLIEMVRLSWQYRIKYGKAWRAKQRALKICYGDWAEAYERLPAMLHAMKAKNPGMHFEYVPKPETVREGDGRQIFYRAFWAFGQCIEAFKHCRDVLSIDGTFLTGKYKGTMLIAIGMDANRQLVPLAFAIVDKESTSSWGWFLRLVRKVVVGPGREICVISDRHAGILNSVGEEIAGHGRVHHRWCTRHLAQNLLRVDHNQQNFDAFEDVCRQTEKGLFKERMNLLKSRTSDAGKEFLDGLNDDKEKWALAYDAGGKRCGFMTSNMAEIYNSLLRGVRALPVTAIASFTFYKCTEWFVDRLRDAKAVFDMQEVWAPRCTMELAKAVTRSGDMQATCFDFETCTYEVMEGGGTTAGGEHRGARKFKVVITNNTCTCGVPQLKHFPCAHMITACRKRGVAWDAPNRMPKWLSMESMVNTWSPRFEPILDEDEWEPYTGPRYVADRGLLITTKGPRRRVRFTMDMDRIRPSKKRRSGAAFFEDPQQKRCSRCHDPGHNRKSCTKDIRI